MMIKGSNLDGFLEVKQVLKLFVKNRYNDNVVSKALVKGFGAIKGVIASAIAHDSHNIIAIGGSYGDIQKEINLIVYNKGGNCFINEKIKAETLLSLTVAGLMANLTAERVAGMYKKLLNLAKGDGCILNSPLMTLSFLALLIIPSLKLSDKGLFEVNSFSFTNLFVQ